MNILISTATWGLLGSLAFAIWKRIRCLVFSPLDNIPGPLHLSFWSGNVGRFFDRHGLKFHMQLAQNYGCVVRMHGPLGRRMLYVYDPLALHSMLAKDQTSFEESSNFICCNQLLFGPGLLSTVGEQHRKQRKMLNPVFSINHMRRLLPIFNQAVHRLRVAISSEVIEGTEEIDMLDWMSRLSLELIGQGGLGYSFDPLVEDAKNEYGDALKVIFAALQDVFFLRPLLPYASLLGSRWIWRRLLDLIPYTPARRLKTLVDVMADHSVLIFEQKKIASEKGDQALERQLEEAKDIMSILMKKNMAAANEDKLDESEVVAQVSTMTLAATDTTSNTACRILHLLAEHPEAQNRLRQEIIEASSGEDISYDELNQLPYLDAIIRESLRLYPPATLISKEAIADTILPLSEPIVGIDGKMIAEIPIARGTEIYVGILGSNTNKAMWGEDALEWKPERWLSPLPRTLMETPIPGVYSKLMSFLGGKRACIGFKFAEVEIKTILFVLLSAFTFDVTKKSIVWNVATVNYPTVGMDSAKPEMPLRVQLVS